MSKKLSSLTILLVLISMVLSACGGAAPATEASSDAMPAEKVQVR